MPNVNDLKKSNFLKKEDVGSGSKLTVLKVAQYNVAKEGAEEDLKYCIEFQGVEKPMVLNTTNAEAIAKICGSIEFSDWPGTVVVAYNDPNVRFGTKVTGGIRIRPLKNGTVAAPKIGQPLDEKDELPF